MYSIANPCSKRVSTLKLALKTLFRHENSSYSCLFSVWILRPIRPVKMNKTAHNRGGEKFRGNGSKSSRKHVLCVLLDWF